MNSKTKPEFSPELEAYIKSLDFETILPERKVLLFKLIDYLNAGLKAEKPLEALFVCTHNSRRSQFAQLWSEIAANYFGITFKAFSAGTEETACYTEALKAIERSGCKVSVIEQAENNNSVFKISWGNDKSSELFSKTLSHHSLPKVAFAAVMTCSEAESNCPIVPGSEIKIPLTYEDPKKADNRSDKSMVYDKTCHQIATELFYVFKQLSVK